MIEENKENTKSHTHTHLPSLLFVNLKDEHKRLKKIKLLSEKLHAEETLSQV